MAKSVMLKGMCILSVGSRKKLFPTETSLVGSSCPTSTLSLTSTQGHIRFLLLGFPIGVICKVVRVKKNVFSLDISLSGVYSLSSSCKCFFYLSLSFIFFMWSVKATSWDLLMACWCLPSFMASWRTCCTACTMVFIFLVTSPFRMLSNISLRSVSSCAHLLSSASGKSSSGFLSESSSFLISPTSYAWAGPVTCGFPSGPISLPGKQ